MTIINAYAPSLFCNLKEDIRPVFFVEYMGYTEIESDCDECKEFTVGPSYSYLIIF